MLHILVYIEVLKNLKKEKFNKIKVKTYASAYYKDEEDKTIQKIVLKLIEKEIEGKVSSDEASKQHNSTLL